MEDENKKAIVEETNELVLENIDLSVRSGQLLVVTGKSGSGKTTLLLAALRETCEKAGEVRVKGSTAYVE